MARSRAVGKRAGPERALGRREEIMRSAGAVLRQRRGGGLRMREVAERLGLVKGNIYYYFKDRQDLLYHCHVRCVEISLAALAEIEAGRGSPREQLRQVLLRHIHATLGTDYGGVLRADIDEMKPAQRRRYVVLRDRFEAGIRRLIDKGVAAGEFRRTKARFAGFAMLGAINWMHKWYRADGAASLDDLAAWFAEFFLAALEA